MNKKIIQVVLMFTMLVSLVPCVQAATLTNNQIEGAISWAKGKLGSQSYNYYCLAFVSDAWKSQGIGNKGYSYATLAGNAMITHTDKNPPRGAVVFWDWYGTIEGVYKNWGHVGIALGDGTAIHADYNGVKITNLNIDSSRTYRGWGGWDGNTIPNSVDTSKSRWRVTATDGINVRSNAGTGYNKVGALAYNTYFYITERKKADGYTWGKTDTGWVVLDYATHVSGPIPDIKNDTVPTIHKDENAHVRNGYFTFRNVASNKCLQVNSGTDTNGRAIDMWSFDGSIDQRFNVVHKGGGKYKLYAECSSAGNNRVVDICRGEAAPAEGQKVELWTPNDNTAQLFYIWPVSDTEYVFELASKTGYVICPSNASAAGTDGSQLILQKYTGASYQKWKLCNNNGKQTTPSISYANGSYMVDTDGDPLNMRSSASASSNLVASIPDKTTLKITQVNSNWGYTSYGGHNGWICLDFTTYTVTLDSITISTMPDKISYYTGEQFDPLGMRIKANYSNGQSEELTTGFTTSANFSTPGNKNITVSYKGKTTSFSVSVEDVVVSELAIQENIIKRTYNVGEILDTTGLYLIASYNNGETALIDSGFTTDYDFSTPGTKTVTVSYGGKSTSYNVEVLENTSSDTPRIEISSEKCYSGLSAIVEVKLKSEDVYDGNMTIEYNSDKLKVDDVEVCGALSGKQVTINKEYSANQIRISFSGTTPVISNAAILRIKFTAFDNAEDAADITITETKMYNKTGNAITVYSSNGKIDITTVVNSAEVTNVQSVGSNGRKIVTANVSSDKVVCYLVSYRDGQLIECDKKYPVNGYVELSITNNDNVQFKFMVWNEAMKPMIETKNIY